MNAVNTLKETAFAIAELSKSEKVQLLRWLEREVKNVFPGIEKNPNVMGGAVCIRQTRIPFGCLNKHGGRMSVRLICFAIIPV